MKIAIGIFRLVPRGGLEDHAVRIADELARRGHEVTVHATGELPDIGVATVSIDRAPIALGNHDRMSAFAASFKRMTQGRFDRIVGFQPMAGLDVLFLADHLRNRPDAPLLKRLLPRHRTFARLEAACFGAESRTRIMGLARPQLEAFAERYPHARSRMTILPPTISDARRKPHLRAGAARRQMRANLGLAGDSPIWLWLGLQPHIKGLDRVIEALALVPAATLLVGGPAPGDGKLEASVRRAAQRGVSDRIRWLGYLPADDVPGRFAVADVLAHPARTDVTGAVILEALINGLPVVTTSCCGFAEHVELSGAGAVVACSPFDVKDFAAALSKACGPGNEALSRKAVAYGESPELYSGLSVACDLIEAATWPKALTMAADAVASQAAAAMTSGRDA